VVLVEKLAVECADEPDCDASYESDISVCVHGLRATDEELPQIGATIVARLAATSGSE
jgi:hypothetical protein